jgi:hypothetical protein|uniref:Uncharacterized protein n=1 Tax=Diphylleia rotans TaxID=190327 RepID=A0A146I737_9EUKA|nr:hypothetical protein A5449_gp24 [Diphylleia rotans]BAU71456.1 hypothetical protein [Diphylleia rotans]
MTLCTNLLRYFVTKLSPIKKDLFFPPGKEGVQKKTVRFFWLPGGHLLFPLGIRLFSVPKKKRRKKRPLFSLREKRGRRKKALFFPWGGKKRSKEKNVLFFSFGEKKAATFGGPNFFYRPVFGGPPRSTELFHFII